MATPCHMYIQWKFETRRESINGHRFPMPHLSKRVEMGHRPQGGRSPLISSSDVEAEAEAPEAVAFWWKRKQKHLKICHFRFHSISKLLFEFQLNLLTRNFSFQILFDIYLYHI